MANFYGLISKEEFLKEEDNPYRILNLLTYAGLTITAQKPQMAYLQFECKLKDKYMYIRTNWYHGWTYYVAVTDVTIPYDLEYGYLNSTDFVMKNSEEFYYFFKELYEEENK